MVLRNFSYSCVIVFLAVTYLAINQYQSAPVIKAPSLDPQGLLPQAKKFGSLINQGRNIENCGRLQGHLGRFRCLKGWKQFGGSCYYPSIMKSTPDKANETCSLLHVNNTYLMRIRHPVELSYAAHVYFTNNLTTLLVETDPRLFKSKMFMDMILAHDRSEWEIMENKLHQVRLQFKPKRKPSNLMNENDDIYSSDEDKDIFQRFNDISSLCDHYTWIVFNNNSHTFTFTTYKLRDKMVCSLSDVDLNSTYEHVCQYVLNFCFGNVMCGKHGECVNNLEGFKCSCSFFFTGVLCEKFSHQIIQLIIGGIFALLFSLYLLIRKILACLNRYCRKEEPIQNNGQNTQNNGQSTRNTTSNRQELQNTSKKQSDEKNFKRSILVGSLGFIFFCLLLVIPTVVQFHSFPFHNIDPLKSQLMIDAAVSMLKRCERTSFISMNDLIFLGISIALTIIFVLFGLREKPRQTEGQSSSGLETNVIQSEGPGSSRSRQRTSLIHREPPLNSQSGIEENIRLLPLRPPDSTSIFGSASPVPQSKYSYGSLSLFELYRNIDRYEIAAIFGILTFEILKVFDEVLFSISKGSSDGVLIVFLKRLVVVFLIGSRYYPTLLSLRLKNPFVKFFAFVHIIIIITYTIYRESFCLDFLPHSENFSALDEVQLRIKLSTWLIIYGLIVNVPHFLLLSYIGAEFSTRLVFDLRFGPQQNGNEHLLPPRQESTETNGHSIDNRTRFKKLLDYIYQWNGNFLFSTMILSTYTVNFIILFHLTCTFTFLYTTRMMSPIAFLTNTLEQLLNIEMKERFLHVEIILSAIISALIYGIQLFLSMKNYRKDISEDVEKPNKTLLDDTGVSKEEVGSKAIQYPGYLIRYTIGGFVITFHLLIVFALICRLILSQYYTFKWILEFILPIVILYALQLLTAHGSSRLIITNDETNGNTRGHPSQFRRNVKNILQYFILVANCFIGIVSAIIRLMMQLIFNIINMNRIDLCAFPKPMKGWDSAYKAYQCFLYEEATFLQNERRPDGLVAHPAEPSAGGEQIGEKIAYEPKEPVLVIPSTTPDYTAQDIDFRIGPVIIHPQRHTTDGSYVLESDV